jgi:predicted ATPase
MTKLRSLRIRNYKAFEDTVFEPDSKNLTVVIGNNGSGKTSLWEVLSLIARLANGWQLGWLTRQFAGRGRNFLGCLPWHRADEEFSIELHLQSETKNSHGDIVYRVGWTANAGTGEPQLTTEDLEWDKTRLLSYDRTTARYRSSSPAPWRFLERNYPLVLSTVGRQVLANTRFAAVKDAFDDVARWGVYRFRVLDLGKSLRDLDVGAGPRESLTVVGENLPLVLHAWKEAPDRYPFAALRSTIRVMLNRMDLADVDWDVRTEVAGGAVYAFVRFFRTRGQESDWFDLAYGPDGLKSYFQLAVALLDRSSFVAIEEPESHLEPRLMDLLAAQLEETASSRQVLITTHSPVLTQLIAPHAVRVLRQQRFEGIPAEVGRDVMDAWLTDVLHERSASS